MITSDQPKIFGPAIRAAISSRTDGNMKFGGIISEEVVNNRQVFLAKCGMSLDQAILVNLDYGKTDFAVYKQVGRAQAGNGMHGQSTEVADALATDEPGVALFLPLADCVGAILYNPTKKFLMVSHLGRHSIEQYGGRKSVEFLVEKYGCNPKDILVWLSPAAGKAEYPLYAFEHRSMHEAIHEQLSEAGVLLEHIETSPIDTTRSEDYFSHSQFLKGNRTDDGRFAIIAMLEQGEPA